jgi:DNA-binding NarL/FixJ family response regulator
LTVEERVAVWRSLYRQGRAGELCDLIVQSRDVPDALLAALAAPRLPTRPTRARKQRLLTPRQQQVLHLASVGWRDAAIAEALDISYFTVKRHWADIFRAFGLRGRTRAVAEGIRRFELV